MNVNTSQNAVMAASSDVNSTQPQAKNVNNKTSEKSFDEEMKSASKPEETNDVKETVNKENADKSDKENQELKTVSKSQDKEFKKVDDIVSSEILNGELNFTDFKYHNESQAILSQNIQSLLNTKDIMTNVNNATHIDYDSLNMSEGDAMFFANLVQNTDMSVKGIMTELNVEIVENSQNVQQGLQVSSILMEKLSESLKTNRPFRIDFDKDISVIIKVNKDGSLAANFIPGDKAVEQYLRNNIASLRQRFDDENLSYSELTYSNSKNEQQKRKKENKNE